MKFDQTLDFRAKFYRILNILKIHRRSQKFSMFLPLNFCTGPDRNGRISVEFQKYWAKFKSLCGRRAAILRGGFR
jgi:hypothetical protein